MRRPGEDLIERLPELVNGDAALVRRGRLVSLTMLVGVGEQDYYVAVEAGRIAALAHGPLLMRPWRFAVRADAEAWQEHWRPMPRPAFCDLFAFTKFGRGWIEGDLHPFMANLRYFKEALAAPRRLAGAA